jgi:hypothetical protein
MEADDSGPDPIIREIRVSAAALWNALDLSGAAATLALITRAPWRSICLTATAGVVVHFMKLSDPYTGITLLLGMGMALVELFHRRDYVTTRHVVRQSGLLGGRRIKIPLVEIVRVAYSYPRFGKALNAGDVDVVGQGRGFTFLGVSEPEDLAAFILRAKEDAAARSWAQTPMTSPPA